MHVLTPRVNRYPLEGSATYVYKPILHVYVNCDTIPTPEYMQVSFPNFIISRAYTCGPSQIIITHGNLFPYTLSHIHHHALDSQQNILVSIIYPRICQSAVPPPSPIYQSTQCE